MGISCMFGFHNWDGCKCPECGKVRDEEHDWSKDCEKCTKCGKERQGAHNWDGCKCTKCRKDSHDWADDCEKCSKCGEARQNVHKYKWNGCKCELCGKTRDENHDWSTDCEKCSDCGATRQNSHKWKGCKCTHCGKTKDEGHEWDGCQSSRHGLRSQIGAKPVPPLTVPACIPVNESPQQENRPEPPLAVPIPSSTNKFLSGVLTRWNDSLSIKRNTCGHTANCTNYGKSCCPMSRGGSGYDSLGCFSPRTHIYGALVKGHFRRGRNGKRYWVKTHTRRT